MKKKSKIESSDTSSTIIIIIELSRNNFFFISRVYKPLKNISPIRPSQIFTTNNSLYKYIYIYIQLNKKKYIYKHKYINHLFDQSLCFCVFSIAIIIVVVFVASNQYS